MTYKVKYIGIGFITTAIFIAVFGMFYTVKANPSYFIRQNGPANAISATSSVSYMTPGLATTTYYLDSGVGTAGSADRATLLVQFIGSSSPLSILNISYEYSQGGQGVDCTVATSTCDWYQDNTVPIASTTQSIGNIQTKTWTFASTTQGQQFGVGTNGNRTLKAMDVPTPTRYVRAILSVPTGSLNGAVWAEFVAKRQAN